MIERRVEVTADCDICGQSSGRCVSSIAALAADLTSHDWSVNGDQVVCPSCMKKFERTKKIVEPSFVPPKTAIQIIN